MGKETREQRNDKNLAAAAAPIIIDIAKGIGLPDEKLESFAVIEGIAAKLGLGKPFDTRGESHPQEMDVHESSRRRKKR